MKKISGDSVILVMSAQEAEKMRAMTRLCVDLTASYIKKMEKVMRETGNSRVIAISGAEQSKEILYELMSALAE